MQGCFSAFDPILHAEVGDKLTCAQCVKTTICFLRVHLILSLALHLQALPQLEIGENPIVACGVQAPCFFVPGLALVSWLPCKAKARSCHQVLST